MPTVSVIIPTYNNTTYLQEAIGSVLSQSHKPAEILLVDDCSTGEHKLFIEQVCQQNEKVRLIRLERNRGVAYARNEGIKNAKGDFVLLLDDDDLLAPEMIEHSMKEFKDHPEAEVVVAKGEAFTEAPDRTTRRKKAVFDYNQDRYGNKPVSHRAFFLIYSPMIHAMLFRKEVFDIARFREELKYGEDRFLWMELRARDTKFLVTDWQGGFYRLTSKASRHKTSDKKIFFQKLLQSGFLSSSFESGYAYSMVFLLSLKSGSVTGIFTYGARAFLRPYLLIGITWNLLRVRLMAYFITIRRIGGSGNPGV